MFERLRANCWTGILLKKKTDNKTSAGGWYQKNSRKTLYLESDRVEGRLCTVHVRVPLIKATETSENGTGQHYNSTLENVLNVQYCATFLHILSHSSLATLNFDWLIRRLIHTRVYRFRTCAINCLYCNILNNFTNWFTSTRGTEPTLYDSRGHLNCNLTNHH